MDLIGQINELFTAVDAVVIGLIVSALVQALPEPDRESGKFYRFLYKFAHLIVANWKLVNKQNKEDKADKMTLINRNTADDV